MVGMAFVSIDLGVIILGKNSNYIIIIHSIIGGWDDASQGRSEILSFNGVEWTEVGQLGITRGYAAATAILVDHTICD
jgi:hypothetical protein